MTYTFATLDRTLENNVRDWIKLMIRRYRFDDQITLGTGSYLSYTYHLHKGQNEGYAPASEARQCIRHSARNEWVSGIQDHYYREFYNTVIAYERQINSGQSVNH